MRTNILLATACLAGNHFCQARIEHFVMRTNILIAMACLAGIHFCQAQGTVNFANLGPGLNAPVYDGNGNPAAAGWLAQLLLGTGGGSLTAVGAPANIGSAAPGYFNGGVVTVNQVAPGALATFQVFAWDGASGATTYAAGLAAWNAGTIWGGYSNPVTVTMGGVGTPPSPPALLIGLQPWGPIPEPSTTRLALWGAIALVLLRRRRHEPR
jgi:hypothetical protein